jgi:hypothetical protein
MTSITDQLPETVEWEIQMLSLQLHDDRPALWREVDTVRDPDNISPRLDAWKLQWEEREFRVVELRTTRKVHSA